MLKQLYLDNNIVSHKDLNRGGDCLERGYDDVYEIHLNLYKNKKINLLQIGIYCGDDLLIYDKFFDNVKLFGYDINLNNIVKTQESSFLNKIVLKEIDSTNSVECNKIEETFDIIIDDGDHNPLSMIKTFCNFYKKLNIGGKYFIEDLKTGRDKYVKYFLNRNKIKFSIHKKDENHTHSIIVINKYENKDIIFYNMKEELRIKKDIKRASKMIERLNNK